MYKLCKTEESSKRQREIEQVLLDIMREKRYDEITVSEICERSGVPRKSFYRYFASKDGALYALIDHTLADFFQMPVPDKKTRGNAIGDLDLYFTFWYQNRTLLDALQRSTLSGILVERSTSFALREGHLPKQFKRLRPEQQGLTMAFSVCGLMSMILQWHRQGFLISPDEMTRLVMDLLTTPLLG